MTSGNRKPGPAGTKTSSPASISRSATATSAEPRGPKGTNTSSSIKDATPGPTGTNDTAACQSFAEQADRQKELTPDERRLLEKTLTKALERLDIALKMIQSFEKGELGQRTPLGSTKRSLADVFLGELKDIFIVDPLSNTAVDGALKHIKEVLSQIRKKLCGGTLIFEAEDIKEPSGPTEAGAIAHVSGWNSDKIILARPAFFHSDDAVHDLIHETAHSVGANWGYLSGDLSERRVNQDWQKVDSTEKAFRMADSFASFIDSCVRIHAAHQAAQQRNSLPPMNKK